MLNVESVVKGFGDHLLFDNTGFQINYGERIGLVGKNGFGKTTLIKMIMGEQNPDEGSISVPSDYRIGYLSQKISFSRPTVLGECMQGLADFEKDHYWKAEKILAGLGFSDTDMQKDPLQFSGGFQVRLNLAKVLVCAPDLLILDEPTNYLDITSIRWLSDFLNSWPRELLLVTHDRSFMDKVVTHICGINRKKIRKIEGNTEKYYSRVAKDEEIYEKTRRNEEKKQKEIENFISRFRAKARLASLVQSRVKTLEKNRPKEKLAKESALEFSFNCVPFSGKQVMKAEHLNFSYSDEYSLIRDFSLTVYPGDRIGIIGMNGKGKTTLLKILAGKMDPSHGKVTWNPNVKSGYFEQTNIKTLVDSFTVEEEIHSTWPDLTRQQTRNICGAMMFEGDKALRKISVLSGGEKSRVMIGKLLVTPLNLLLLDEPGNHLDMESCDSFTMALEEFEGTVVLVTHNEMFLNTLANRLIVFHNEGISIFEGTYQKFLENVGWEQEATPGKKNNNGKPGIGKKELRQARSRIISERSKAIRPVQSKIDKAERAIELLEQEIENLNEAIIQSTQSDGGNRIESLSVKLSEKQRELDERFEKLETWLQALEEKETFYEEKLNEVEREDRE
ncbi:MAG: ATP-binding cassette domain-containing protein [Desulfarculaceae bacterium]|nr:ATP-binding cassette domain-containing protein [Desulfarculaceae bacterium]